MKGMCKELGRLAQGYGEKGADDYVKGTNTVLFMDLDEIKTIPNDQVVTYARIVVDYQPQIKDPNCVRITAGGTAKTSENDSLSENQNKTASATSHA